MRNAGWRASRRRCRRKTQRPPPNCFCPTVSGATCWPSPGPSRPCPAGRQSTQCCAKHSRARSRGHFHFPARRTPPRWLTRAGTEAIEALFEFETAFGPGAGVVRLVPDASSRLRAWTIVTTLEELKGHEETFRSRAAQANDGIRDFGAENWSDRLARARTYADHDPTVIVVGGGQGGLSIAARLHQLGIDTLIVDRHPRVGDNWRTRYHSLTLHNEVHVNHLPYLPFPPTFPVYIPKDKLANWFESYVEAMELNFWTDSELVAGSYDETRGEWRVTLRRSDGSERVMRPRHLIFATGVSSIPYTPELPGLRQLCRHQSAFRRLQGRQKMERPQGARAWHRHQRPRCRPGAARAWRRRHHHPAQQDLCGEPERGAERLRHLFRRHPVRGLRSAGDLVSLSRPAAFLPAVNGQGPRGGRGAARSASKRAASACILARTTPASR